MGRSAWKKFLIILKEKDRSSSFTLLREYICIYIYIYMNVSIYKKFITNIYIYIHIYAYKPMFLRRFLHTIAPISPDLFLFINNNFFKSRPTQKMEMRKKWNLKKNLIYFLTEIFVPLFFCWHFCSHSSTRTKIIPGFYDQVIQASTGMLANEHARKWAPISRSAARRKKFLLKGVSVGLSVNRNKD